MRKRNNIEAILQPGSTQKDNIFLACVHYGMDANALVQYAIGWEKSTKISWHILHVETAYELAQPVHKRQATQAALRLAESSGAKVTLVHAGDDPRAIADAISTFARRIGSHQLLLGRSYQHRNPFQTDVASILLREYPDLEILVCGNTNFLSSSPAEPPERSRLLAYFGAFGLAFFSTLVGILFEKNLAPANVLMTFLLGVIIAALYLGRGPSILTALLNAFAFYIVFIPPRFSFEVQDSEYLILLLGFMIVSIVISTLVNQRQGVSRAASEREFESNLLFTLSHDLSGAQTLANVGEALEKHLMLEIGSQIRIYLPTKGKLQVAYSGKNKEDPQENDIKKANWTFANKEPSGAGMTRLPSSEPIFLPLSTLDKTIGVLEYRPVSPVLVNSANKQRLLNAICTQAALALQRIDLAEQAREIRELRAAEKLQAALLNSISHELRTPLVSITGTLTYLESQPAIGLSASDQEMVEVAATEAQRLNRLVGDLLDMTRLESGSIQRKMDWVDCTDLIGSVLDQMGSRIKDREVKLNLPVGLPLVYLDFTLMSHVLNNILDNAIKYSPPTEPIEITAIIEAEDHTKRLTISILDRGIGVPKDDLPRIFDKFYRGVNKGRVNGLGLGLAICKGILDAHNGKIIVSNRDGGGTIVKIGLPL